MSVSGDEVPQRASESRPPGRRYRRPGRRSHFPQRAPSSDVRHHVSVRAQGSIEKPSGPGQAFLFAQPVVVALAQFSITGRTVFAQRVVGVAFHSLPRRAWADIYAFVAWNGPGSGWAPLRRALSPRKPEERLRYKLSSCDRERQTSVAVGGAALSLCVHRCEIGDH